MSEFGTKTVRSAHALNIFKKPTAKPMWVVEGASTRGGRRILAAHGLDDEGGWTGQSEDMGSLRGRDKEPFFYMSFLGGTMSLGRNDMHEMIEGMRETRMEKIKREGERPLPDFKKMYAQLQEAQQAINERRRGLTRFSGVEVPRG